MIKIGVLNGMSMIFCQYYLSSMYIKRPLAIYYLFNNLGATTQVSFFFSWKLYLLFCYASINQRNALIFKLDSFP